jgi:hypothetical protein
MTSIARWHITANPDIRPTLLLRSQLEQLPADQHAPDSLAAAAATALQAIKIKCRLAEL